MNKLVGRVLVKSIYLAILMVLYSLPSFSQSVGIGTTNPNPNAVLHIDAPNGNQGLLIPRLTTVQRTALGSKINISANPSSNNSLLVFDVTDNQFYFFFIFIPTMVYSINTTS